jgi:hypothetical protein
MRALAAGEASVYWYALPAKPKRYRLWDAPYRVREFDALARRHQAGLVAKLFERASRSHSAMTIMETTPISEHEFRLPFRRIA